MATLSANASAEEIDDEIIFQQTLLDSLGDIDEYHPERQQIEEKIAELTARLDSLATQSVTISGAVTPSLDDSDSAMSTLPAKRAAPGSPQGRSSKRQADSGSSSHRLSSSSRPFTSSQVGPSQSALERQRRAEEAARQRRAAEQADLLFARQLMRQAESSSATSVPQPSSSGTTPTVPRNNAPPAFVSYGPPRQPERVMPPIKNEKRPSSSSWPTGVVDLTGDSDSSQDYDNSTFGSFARVPRELAGHSGAAKSGSSHSAQQTTMDRLMYAQNFARQREQREAHARQRALDAERELVQARERARQGQLGPRPTQTWAQAQAARIAAQQGSQDLEYDEQRMLDEHTKEYLDATASLRASGMPPDQQHRLLHELSKRQQRDRALAREQRRILEARAAVQQVYQMPGAYPVSQQPHRPSIYESQSSQRTSLLGKMGKTLSSYQDDLRNLGNLLGGDFAGPSRSRWDDSEGEIDDEQLTESLKNLMDNIRPDEEIVVEDEDVEIESMTVKLKPYQNAGLKWLQNMEDGTNKGGILADDMGLGKTVQAIALMSTRRSENPRCKTNLIIAPVALLRQWKEEIATKLKRGSHALTVYIHHGAQKKKSFSDLCVYDVVITTFGTLAAEMRKRDFFNARRETDPAAIETPSDKCIFIDERSKWFRVIIDEAQNIKNRSTQSSRAACHINATYRLCMTGTPMMNSPDELHSLIRFLRIKPYNEWTRFSMDFSRPLKSQDEERRGAAMQKLQVLLKAILLRRAKKSKVNGKPILVLPERTVEETNPVFTEEERDFYVALESQSRITFNKYVKSGTVGKKYAHILVMLLRLRQACCHPHLVKDFGVAMAADISQETMDDIARSLLPAVVERIKASDGEFECPVCYDAVQNPAIFVPCGHDTCADCYVKIKDAAAGGNYADAQGNAKCPNCRGAIDPKQVIDYETFKKIHLPTADLEAQANAADAESAAAAAAAAADSETESEADETESEDDDEDDADSDTESLNGFIVNDDEEVDVKGEAGEDDEDVKPKDKGKQPASTRPGALQFSDSESEAVSGGTLKAQLDKGKQPVADDDATESEEDIKRPRKLKVKAESELADDEDHAQEKDAEKAIRKKKKKKKKRGKKKGKKKAAGSPEKTKKMATQHTLAELKKMASRSKTAKKEYLRRVRKEFVMSAKIQKTMELLKHIIDDTDEKIIVFSQWTSLLDLLEVPIDEQGWGYQRYDGSMSARDRGDAIDAFKSTTRKPQIRVMLVSLKAGNAGLNLTCASQVIILDPFWNPYIEEQAIDRAHRLGQEREVKVHRLLIEETVEDRILALQEQKRAMINEALDEGAGQRLSRLNQEQLGYLFGVRRGLPPP